MMVQLVSNQIKYTFGSLHNVEAKL
jgi:hypothetical protein